MNLATRLRALVGVGSRFLVVGAISTLIEIGVFNLLVYVFDWGLVAAKVAASLVALVNAYIGNREWAFRHRDRRGRLQEMVLFVGTNVVCTLLGAGLLWVGVEGLALLMGARPGAFAVNVVNLASIAIVVLVRFVLYHKVVFRVAPSAGEGA